MTNYRKHEKDESARLRLLVEQMNKIHAEMGGRDKRPERVALAKCMAILQKEIERQRSDQQSPPPRIGDDNPPGQVHIRDIGPATTGKILKDTHHG